MTDYCLRLKQTGASVNFHFVKQLPILPPSAYEPSDIRFVVNRVARLTRNHDLINACWLTDQPTYAFGTAEERLQIRAELDAFYALKSGLSRDDLAFILDPQEAEGPDYPSVTFPGLRTKEMKLYGEFRTRRLVLEAYDRLTEKGVEGFDGEPA